MYLRPEYLMRPQTGELWCSAAVTNRDNFRSLNAVCRGISDILCAVRNSLFLVVFVAAVFASQPLSAAGQIPPAPQQETPPPAATPTQPSAPSGPLIVLDPAHGGTDSGARGETIVEKDVVLQMARTVRAELERQGYRVVMTRGDDSNPSYDDRAAVANAHRDAIFISLHVSSTGAPGTVRAYYTQFGTAPVVVAAIANSKTSNPSASQLVVWEEAQRPYLDASRRLADLIQGELAQAFSGSPPTSTGVPVRAMRSVGAPAVAVEVSSVSTPTPDLLTASAAPLGAAIARAIAAFHQTIPGGVR
jgi:N-acetylmuramoyl-L-alanine amidase